MRIGDFGQPRVEALFDEMLTRGRVGGSFLFEGLPGVGKEAVAVELGRLLNCEREVPCAAKPPFTRAADPAAPIGAAARGSRAASKSAPAKRAAAQARTPRSADTAPGAAAARCGSCRKFDTLQHPDLLVVFPVPRDAWEEGPTEGRGGEIKPGTVERILRAKAENPYFRPEDFDAPASIRASVLREHVLPKVASRPVEARFKTIVLSEPERMAPGMANILLKTLEEPPEDCLLVLATAVPQALLPTIVSRCQRIHFKPLAPEWMVPRLQALHDKPLAEAQLAASVSQGSMLAASRFLGGDLGAVRDYVFGVFENAMAGETLELLETAQHLAQEHPKKRHLVPLTLQMLAATARDAILVSQGIGAPARGRAATGGGLRLVNADRIAALERIAARFPAAALHRLLRRAEASERQIAGNAFVEHTLAASFLEVAAVAAPAEKGRRL